MKSSTYPNGWFEGIRLLMDRDLLAQNVSP